MEEPTKPNKEDCCNSGCNPCIFDVYENQLEMYEKFKKSKQFCSNPSSNGISQTEYRSFVISDISNITDSVKMMKFNSVEKLLHKKVTWKPGQHFLFKYVSEFKTCTRAYTPIACKNGEVKHDFYIILKKYENGLVSKALFNLKKGEKTLWRGPYGSYKIEENKYKRIIMVAQGTGIAPFISIIETILNNEDDMTLLTLFFCCCDVKTILLRNQLYAYKSFWNFSYTVFLSSFSDESLKYEEPIVKRKLVTKDLDELNPSASDQFLICGSKAFMSEYKSHLLNLNISEENIHSENHIRVLNPTFKDMN
ncbi:NADH-cytochrome b5 reductase-like [Aricia agestis]|uniref:NADH-cytochrome b5 reductase-like n=1 Tax=Aricia agestis TaxID=91739 RepID=UPI001C2036D8|nr:NADH-cytochrome b5 reductase-like [Aricia agestis]